MFFLFSSLEMESFGIRGRSLLLLLKLLFIHETFMRGILFAAGDFIYRDDNGSPIPSLTVSRTCGRDGPIVLEDTALIQNLAHFATERISERVVHARGGGAYGDFIVTHDITRYTKAAVFSKIGLKTPIIVRFSTVAGEKGSPDVSRNPRGFAIKFYTTVGIWDIVGNNTPIFFLRDPMLFPAMVHSQKLNPKTGRPDNNMMWDFNTLRHETLFQNMRAMSDLGTPDGWRYMDGFGSHTFVLVNANDYPVYCKFHWLTNQGVRNLTAAEATRIAGENPDYSAQDLYDAIEAGDYPSWNFFIQVMTFEQADKFKYSVHDLTKIWPEDEYPLIPVGKLELNRNPENFFHEIEQLAFCPSHMIPGIEPSRDRMLVARMMNYKASQRHRLGPNFMQIPVNCPLNRPTNIYRDGLMNMWNQGSSVNYFPNSFSLYRPDIGADFINYTASGPVARYDTGDDDNYTQPREWYDSLSAYDQDALAANIAGSLKGVKESIQKRVVEAHSIISQKLGDAIASAIK